MKAVGSQAPTAGVSGHDAKLRLGCRSQKLDAARVLHEVLPRKSSPVM